MKSITKEGISEYWEKISSQPYKKWLSFFSEERKRMQLNDWGYAKRNGSCLYYSKNST